MDGVVKKAWMPIVGGIFDIVIGSLILSILFLFAVTPMIVEPVSRGVFYFDLSLFFMVIPGMTIGTLAIVSGVFAIQRRKWGWALAGSIAAALVPIPLGIAAIVLLVLSKNDFR
ncbi:hypothetical protein ACFLUQ_01030 [Chloroflexota bacterium]